MSKIITIFSNPGTYSSTLPSSAVSDKVEDNKTLTALGHTVDEDNFAKSRHVASLFNAISRGRSTHATAQRIGIVSDYKEDHANDIKNLSDAMKNIYGIHGDNAILGSMEVTDAQMEYLESNPAAMEVFIDNATIQADNLSWDKDHVEDRESLCEDLYSAADAVSDLIDVACAAEDEDDDWNDDYDDYDDWNDDYDDYDDWNDDYDDYNDWEEDDDDWFDDWDDEDDYGVEENDEDSSAGVNSPLQIKDDEHISIDDLSPHAQLVVLTPEELERLKKHPRFADAEQLELSFDDVDDE